MEITPNTPITLQLKNGRVATLPAHIVAKIPQLTDVVRNKVKADASGHAIIDMKLINSGTTLDQIIHIVSHICGGPFDPLAASTLLHYGLVASDFVSKNILAFIDMPSKPSRCILSKYSKMGALLALTLKGKQDATFDSYKEDTQNAYAAKTFHVKGMPDSVYTETQITLIPVPSVNARMYEFKMAKYGDLAHTFVLRVDIPPRSDGIPHGIDTLDNLFKSASISIGGNDFDEIDLSSNNAIVRALGLWPKLTNTPPTRTDSNWIVTIPLIFGATQRYTKCFLPITQLYYHESCIKLMGVNSSLCPKDKCALDVDFVFLDTPARTYIANIGAKKAVPKTASEPIPLSGTIPDAKKSPSIWDDATRTWDPTTTISENTPKTSDATTVPVSDVCSTAPIDVSIATLARVFDQHPFVRENLRTGVSEQHIKLLMNHPSSGILLSVKPVADDLPGVLLQNAMPVLSAKLLVNNHVFMEYDISDMTEWNWIKCGVKVPAECGGNRWRTMLMPASRQMFAADKDSETFICPSTVNFSRVDTVELILQLNENIVNFDWELTVTNVCQNIEKFSGGLGGVQFV